MDEPDITEEQQDWRFLSHTNKNNAGLPKRGEKDFEPDGTGTQSSALSDSRQAMYTALSGSRGHSGKNHISAIWYPESRRAKVDVPRGSHFMTIGKADSYGNVWLYPEEVIYLVERGSMECFWPQGITMSLQAVYAACASQVGDIEKYQVYSYLKRVGFVVQRADMLEDNSIVGDKNRQYQPMKTDSTSISLWNLISPGLQVAKLYYDTFISSAPFHSSPYRTYEEIYNKLQYIPCHSPPHSDTEAYNLIPDPVSTPGSPFEITFNVWKPTAIFKKATPGEPDFRVAVVSTRDTKMPTLSECASVFNTVPVDSTCANLSPVQKLKKGWRNFILATVDAGVVNFNTISDVGFGQEKMYLTRKQKGVKATRTQGYKIKT